MATEGMLCPVDRTPLVMSERQAIEIDYCPTCRGVWLDRGELDKIIERGAAPRPPAPPEPRHHREPFRGHDDRHRHKRRKSFLEELFD